MNHSLSVVAYIIAQVYIHCKACLPPIMQQDYINLLRLSVAQLATEVR